MRTGFYTAALPGSPIAEVARWAADAEFDALEVDIARHAGGPAGIATAVDAVRGQGLDVCALTLFGFLLDGDADARERTRSGVAAAVEAAAASGVELVVTFAGRDQSLTEDENYRELAGFLAPLADRAAQGGVRIAIENWPGPRKDFIATTPQGWARLFELVPAPNVGLNFDPSHLVWQGIDHEQPLADVANRIFLAHAKDTEVFAERLQQVGYFGAGWWTYRLPGHGTIDWSRWLDRLRAAGFGGVVSIEHEDRDWGFGASGSDERRRQGLREGLRALRTALSPAADGER
ncbi:MAG: Inosose isomerase [uncultured Thermomicrobiales bacterium]|uniref:Inosose isomerase n=1 Tax=uncultured Thermomicrobiales bacterium TaxID=1645740 RepID=A0A6J4U6R9_9BACT|nr:MAG: Inosose isomerase [uncultured Thermomicrobiales bacterium]